MRIARFAPIAAALAFAAGCAHQIAGTPVAAPDSTFVMEGSVRIAPRLVSTTVNGDCEYAYIDVGAGSAVDVADDQGRKVGAGALTSRGLNDKGECILGFTVDVKLGSDFYQVQVGKSEPVTVSIDQVRNERVGLSFGY
ncbi:hypothetical protein [Rhodococcus ruber]|uniref:hypothetical protein n=1 Tax=Rhodococcus ruber TaxID=1830 RepID=UPI001F3F01A9|nr:hypothetical protein [Rhodococcus ruber]MCF8786888.1 hypothetical protein [Rhodococcus ruber]